MGKISEFNGNQYITQVIETSGVSEIELNALFDFINSHDIFYLYGAGKCGNSFKKYITSCGVSNLGGTFTSSEIEGYMKKYKETPFGIILTMSADYYPEILPLIINKVRLTDIFFLKERTKTILINAFTEGFLEKHFWLTLPVVKQCNINCASCNMYSPICPSEFYSLNQIQSDLEMIKKLDVKLSKINITGGEPFLHPQLLDILQLIREMFPDLHIEVYSNGIIMEKKCDKAMLESIRRSNAEYHITEYGKNIDSLKHLYKKMDDYGISYIVNYIDDEKLFFKKKIDLTKKVPVYEYINCQYYTFCFDLFLYNGILYKCPLALNCSHINNYFGTKIELKDDDYLELKELEHKTEIYNYWRSRIPLCGYCPRIKDVIKWGISERRVEEWT